MRTLKQINAVYEKIIHCDDLNERVKCLKLTSLISELEKDYKLLEQRTVEWVALHRKISNSRTSNSRLLRH